MTAEILHGDALEMLKTLPSESVHCCVTSPPYLGLRCYGVEGQIGLEGSVEEHIQRLVEVFREVKRCLHPSGTLAVNYGDAYACAPNGRSAAATKAAGNDDRTFRDKPMSTVGNGYKAKDLMELPSELARALRLDGWWLRSRIPWLKRSALPESVTDRPSTALEYVFVLARSESYFWDGDAVRRPAQVREYPTWEQRKADGAAMRRGDPGQSGDTCHWAGIGVNPNGRNLRNSDFYFDSLDLAIEQAKAELAHLTHLRERGGLLLSEEGEPLALDVNTEASSVEHFAAYPRKLVQPLIQAGTSERGCCADCGAPWVRVTEKESVPTRPGHTSVTDQTKDHFIAKGSGGNANLRYRTMSTSQTLGWRKSCRCSTDQSQPCTVLDPFCGTSTTLFVALELGRRAIGIELNERYVAMGRRRLKKAQLPLDLAAD